MVHVLFHLIYIKHGVKIHVNDIDSLRILHYNNMKNEEGRNEFYKLQDEVIKNGE